MELTKKQINEFAKEFAHVSKTTIKVDARDYKTMRGVRNHLASINEVLEQKHNEPMPLYIDMDVTWRRTAWGWCPRVSMRWEDASGAWHLDNNAGYASGCGYDKHSAAVAEALNKHFKNLLYASRNRDFKKAPYGIPKYKGSFPYFEGGVGMSCYPIIMDWLGYKMKHVAWTDTYDKWIIVKKGMEKRYA